MNISKVLKKVKDAFIDPTKALAQAKFTERGNTCYWYTPDGKRGLFFYRNEKEEFIMFGLEEYDEDGSSQKNLTPDDCNLDTLYKMLTSEDKSNRTLGWEIIDSNSK
mgnify:CR=1 FL=1